MRYVKVVKSYYYNEKMYSRFASDEYRITYELNTTVQASEVSIGLFAFSTLASAIKAYNPVNNENIFLVGEGWPREVQSEYYCSHFPTFGRWYKYLHQLSTLRPVERYDLSCERISNDYPGTVLLDWFTPQAVLLREHLMWLQRYDDLLGSVE